MKTDANKGITAIAYNHLNLPTSVSLAGGTISYIYDATGVKQRKVAAGTTTEYAGNYIYENGNLKQFSHPEGYVEPDGNGGYDYVYSYLDHLGNVRLNYSDLNGNGSIEASSEILDEKNYYPFGGEHAGYNTAVKGTYYPYGFNGKEENDELGLQWMDYGARNYDKWLGRWMNVDPLADDLDQIDKSPYAFTWNNPINLVDPDGRKPLGDYYDTDGNYLGNDGIDDDKVYEVSQMPGVSSDIEGSGALNIEYIGQVGDVFTTGDAASDEKIQSLHPAIRMKATNFIKEANDGSSNTLIRVAQGLRTFGQQDALYAQGRTVPGNKVTNAKGGHSNHNYGLAFDIAGITDGKIDYNLNWNRLSKLGKSQGFDWGGDWTKFKDKPHFENFFGNSIKDLRQKYNAGNLKNGYINLSD